MPPNSGKYAYCAASHADGRLNTCSSAAIAHECQEWWERNCLYLSEDARRAFSQAYLYAPHHATILKTSQEMSSDDRKGVVDEIKKGAEIIRSAGDAIITGAQLPSLGDDEFRSLDSD